MTHSLVQELEPFAQAAREIQGWELEFAPEPLEPGPPWDYEQIACDLAGDAASVLDLGTGGGEVLSRILPALRGRAVATEWWDVNAPIAAKQLGKAVPVIRSSSLDLPFSSNSFDLLLSRHEEISPREVARVLAPGGCLLTQQVIPDVWHELREVFPDMVRFPDHYAQYHNELQQLGFTTECAREFRHPVRFHKLGHLVYQLAAAPWTIPNFDLHSHHSQLAELDERARSRTGLILTEGYYLLQMKAPA